MLVLNVLIIVMAFVIFCFCVVSGVGTTNFLEIAADRAPTC
jgi:hypothetical protein